MNEQDPAVQSPQPEIQPHLPAWKRYGKLLWLLFVLIAAAVIGGIYVTSQEKTAVQTEVSVFPTQAPTASVMERLREK
jgi:hypothetical protein